MIAPHVRSNLTRRMRLKWFLKDPAGIFTASIALLSLVTILLCTQYTIIRWLGMFSLLGMVLNACILGLFGLCIWAHVMTMTTDPGTIPLDYEIKPLDLSIRSLFEEDCVIIEEEEMTTDDLEALVDDGSVLIACDVCNNYRPVR